MTQTAYQLKVPGIGVLNGRAANGIAEFLNVKFANIDGRFRTAKLADSELGEVDCERQGPLCPQVEPFNDNYNGVPPEECAPLDVRYDEANCLNMWVQIPLGYTNLPVVVWLHGGSNIAGSPYRGSSRAYSWIRNAIDQGKPFIFVSPHYRVGLFGWLPTEDSHNQAIDDQRLAIEWIHKYGKYLGADTSRITLVGQSAGASDAYVHMLDSRSTQLVSQIAVLSGNVGRRALATREQYEALARRIAEHIGCSIEDLRTVDAGQIVEAQSKLGINVYAAIEPDASLRPKLDESFPRLIVSDCEHDGHFFDDVPDAVRATPDGISTDEFFTDIIFRSGANELWRAYPKVMRQLCDGVNPYTPSWGNNHMVELHYIINGYELHSEAISKTQSVWTDLVNMESPWDYKKEAFWIPPHGLPTVISSDKALEKRQIRAPMKDVSHILKLVRGW